MRLCASQSGLTGVQEQSPSSDLWIYLSVAGVPKHHVCNANLMRNGADFSVYMSTAQEFDGCDSGARPDEAVSWGKIRLEANPVKVYGDATILMPLLISQTFARNFIPKE